MRSTLISCSASGGAAVGGAALHKTTGQRCCTCTSFCEPRPHDLSAAEAPMPWRPGGTEEPLPVVVATRWPLDPEPTTTLWPSGGTHRARHRATPCHSLSWPGTPKESMRRIRAKPLHTEAASPGAHHEVPSQTGSLHHDERRQHALRHLHPRVRPELLKKDAAHARDISCAGAVALFVLQLQTGAASQLETETVRLMTTCNVSHLAVAAPRVTKSKTEDEATGAPGPDISIQR